MALYIQFSSAKTHETMQKTALKVTLNEVLEQMLNFRWQFEDETKNQEHRQNCQKNFSSTWKVWNAQISDTFW